MFIINYTLATLTIIGGISIGILLYYHMQTASVWVAFATCTLLILIFCLKWQYSIWKKEKQSIRTKTPIHEEPEFSEYIDNFSFSMEGKGTSTFSKGQLEEEPQKLFLVNNYSPVKVYIKNNNLYADVRIYGGNGSPPIEIIQNKLFNKPPNWDFNSDQYALEVVDEKNSPIYQFIYKTPSHIVLNGIFPFPNGLILTNEVAFIMSLTIPTIFKINRIFKYPSWKYPGEYVKEKH